MASSNPKISFLFPYRWLTEDKEFLKENIKNMVVKDGGREAFNILQTVPMYRVQIAYQYKEPIANFPFTKTLAEKTLKQFFKYGKCVGVDINYEQHTSQTMLPLCDFRVYF